MKFSLTLLPKLLLLLPLATSFCQAGTTVAFLGGFTSPHSGTVLTDLNLEKGLRVFLKNFPAAAKELDFVKFDNKGDASNTAEEVKKIAQKKIRFILGVSKSNHALVVAPLADQNHILFITPAATNDQVTLNHPYVFRTCFSDSYQGKILAKFAIEELKGKRVLVMTNVDTPYSVGLSQSFIASIGDRVKIATYHYLSEEMRIKELPAQIASFKPDIVFIPDYVDNVPALVKEFYRIDQKLNFLGGDGWGGREVMDPMLSPLTDLKAYYAAIWNIEFPTPENQAFVRQFKLLYPNDTVRSASAGSYDALTIFWEAYKEAKSPKTPESVRKVLLSKTFNTTIGKVSFPNPMDPTPAKPVLMIRFQAGTHALYKTY